MSTNYLHIDRGPQQFDWVLDDFLTVNRMFMAASNSGGSSNVAENSASADRKGIMLMDTGSAASTNQRGGVATAIGIIRFGGGFANLCTMGFKPNVVHDAATLTGFFRAGFGNTNTTTIPTDGAEVATANGGNYILSTVASGVYTNTDTAIAPVVGEWQDFSIYVRPDASAVEYYRVVSNVPTLIATHTTNIPTGSVGVRAICLRSQATATSIVYGVDYIGLGRTFPFARWPRV